METPNTVNELLESQEGVNDELTPEMIEEDKDVAKLMKKVMKKSPAVGLEVASRIIDALETFHQTVLEDMVKDENIDATVLWTKDLATLRHIQTMLETITL